MEIIADKAIEFYDVALGELDIPKDDYAWNANKTIIYAYAKDESWRILIHKSSKDIVFVLLTADIDPVFAERFVTHFHTLTKRNKIEVNFCRCYPQESSEDLIVEHMKGGYFRFKA